MTDSSNNSPKIRDHIRRFGAFSILVTVFMAGVAFTVFFYITQIVPLREELKELKAEKQKYPKSLSDNKELDTAKKQIEQLTEDNKKLKDRINQIEVVKKRASINKKDKIIDNKIEHKSSSAKGDVCIQCGKIHPKSIQLNKSEGFCNNEIFITLKSINEKNEIDAVVNSSGDREMIINKGVAGKTYTYTSANKIYEIRIMGVEYKDEFFKEFASAQFLVEIK